MAVAAAATARLLIRKLSPFHSSFKPLTKTRVLRRTSAAFSTLNSRQPKCTQQPNDKRKPKQSKSVMDSQVKRRTRSDKELDEETFSKHYGNENSAHVPVLLGEVLDVFASVPLSSFVDCTLGAAGHSSEIIQAHPEMKIFVGLDIDPIAHEIAKARIEGILHRDSCESTLDLQVHTYVKNYKNVKSVLSDFEGKLLGSGVNGILMDLGMSSMQVNNAERGFSVLSNGPLDMRMDPQASLTAEDILNSWPEAEVGKVLREYGEESNWYHLQNKIVKARLYGGLHSTAELVDLIRSSTAKTRGGRQGWIKTATRVFQALRIAVNDELNTLQNSIYACFDCLSSGGRLAVISFHSLEDRIVKQAFLNIINSQVGDYKSGNGYISNSADTAVDNGEKESWIRQTIGGKMGTILTKRPITPSEKEEALNPRSRSAKLRVIQKV